MPPAFVTTIGSTIGQKKATLLNGFLKTNTGNHIQTNFILFLAILSFMSHKQVSLSFFKLFLKLLNVNFS